MSLEFATLDDVGMPTIDQQVSAADQTGGETKPGADGASAPAGEVKAGESPTPEQVAAAAVTEQAKEKGNLQKRFDELAAEKWAARQEAEQAKQRMAELEAKLAAAQKSAPATSDPTREAFETEEAYIRALVAHGTAQELATARKADEDARVASEAQERHAKLRGKLQQGGAKYPDFQTVAFDSPFPYTPQMLEAMTRIEDPASVAYHLGKNPQLGFELAGMRDPFSVAMKIGEVQAIVRTSGAVPEPKSVTKALEPSKPVVGGGGGVSPDAQTLANMSQGDFNRHMWQQRQAKGQRI